MKETLIVAIVLFVYLILSYIVYLRLIKTRWIGFALLSGLYLAVTYSLFFLVFGIVNENFYPLFYISSAHISNTILTAFAICAVASFINIVAAMARKESSREPGAKHTMKAIVSSKKVKRSSHEVASGTIH